jgi:DNA-binding transcriptional regulator YhcF (GntR family)
VKIYFSGVSRSFLNLICDDSAITLRAQCATLHTHEPVSKVSHTMIYRLGSQAQRVVDSLRSKIRSGQWTPGMKMPSHTTLAQEFGVAPLTVRHALSVLEQEGFISRQHGRGTFVQNRNVRKVLVVDDSEDVRVLLQFYISDAGFLPVLAPNPETALKHLINEPDIAMVFSDVRMPEIEDGVHFIRSVRRRWPDLPLAAITGFPDDLAELHGTPECPILILTKPIFADHVNSAIKLVFNRGNLANRS